MTDCPTQPVNVKHYSCTTDSSSGQQHRFEEINTFSCADQKPNANGLVLAVVGQSDRGANCGGGGGGHHKLRAGLTGGWVAMATPH